MLPARVSAFVILIVTLVPPVGAQEMYLLGEEEEGAALGVAVIGVADGEVFESEQHMAVIVEGQVAFGISIKFQAKDDATHTLTGFQMTVKEGGKLVEVGGTVDDGVLHLEIRDEEEVVRHQIEVDPSTVLMFDLALIVEGRPFDPADSLEYGYLDSELNYTASVLRYVGTDTLLGVEYHKFVHEQDGEEKVSFFVDDEHRLSIVHSVGDPLLRRVTQEEFSTGLVSPEKFREAMGDE